MNKEDIAVDSIVTYLEPGMYLIAACLPRLRSLCSRLHASLSSSLASLRARRQYLPSPDLPGDVSSPTSDDQPHTNIKVAGQGDLDSPPRNMDAVA